MSDELKRVAGYAAVDRWVRDGTCIGLGTGTTARWAIERVGARIAEGARIEAVATSLRTEALCREARIPLRALGERELDVAIDGADEVAADLSLTKGGGGALFREKAVALAARRFVAIVTPEKLVARLGAFPTPVEVVPFSAEWVSERIERELGARVAVRAAPSDGGASKRYVTDNGNAILDCAFGSIEDPAALDGALRAIHGVVATGLFVGLASVVLIARVHGIEERTAPL